MKNITVSVDDATYRQARICAAQQDTSVSALVKRFLIGLSATETEADQLKRDETRLRELIVSFRAGDRLQRTELHDRPS